MQTRFTKFRCDALLVALVLISGHFSLAEERPNILFIISDDQAWYDYGFMGHPYIETPRIDELAASSLTFSRGYVPSPLCRPSLATMITGLYPHQHGITSNDPAAKYAHQSPDWERLRQRQIDTFRSHKNLADVLGAYGYVSFQSGKWWEGNWEEGGFTSGMTEGRRHGDKGLEIGRQTMEPLFEFMKNSSQDEKPFFAWYAPFLPHTPHNPTKAQIEKYLPHAGSREEAAYWAMCEWFDNTCGALLDFLDTNNLSENTLVVYICDNGWDTNANLRKQWHTGKRSPYDSGIRTPIMLRWTERINPRMDVDNLAYSIDLVPTIYNICGIQTKSPSPGIDLLDLEQVEKRKFIHGAGYLHNAIDVDVPASSLKYRWIIKGDYKLIDPYERNFPEMQMELYHIGNDIHEETNLIHRTDKQSIVAELSTVLNAWLPEPDPQTVFTEN